MERIYQEIIDGCGVACLAMVTGIDYRRALGVLHPCVDPDDHQVSHETANEDLLEAIKQAGFEVNVRARPDIRTLKDAVLVVRYRIGDDTFMHSVVWDSKKQQVLDPFDDRPFEEYEQGLCLAFELHS